VIRAVRVLAMLLAGAVCARAEPRIEWVKSEGRIQVEVRGLDHATLAVVRDRPAEKWNEFLKVGVRQGAAVQMLGAWQADPAARVLRFTPRFPLTPGVAYRAEFDGKQLPGAASDQARIVSEYTVPEAPSGPGTVVTNVFPSAAELPENLLKFYLHFSAPMSRGHIYDYIHLRDESGKDVELPFLEIDEELWDPEMKRLTLFIDPGRIKRGVRPLEEIGPSLEEGRRFTLAIDAAWLDANGRPLVQKYEHSFRVGPPDRTPIAPAEWKLAAPAAASIEPLGVNFSESIDRALALRLLRVVRDDGSPVDGIASVADAERRWTFTPSRPWQPGVHQLVVPATLEDLAGNNVGKAFEVELSERHEPLELGQSVNLTFQVR
jgi:hypothetical protein